MSMCPLNKFQSKTIIMRVAQDLRNTTFKYIRNIFIYQLRFLYLLTKIEDDNKLSLSPKLLTLIFSQKFSSIYLYVIIQFMAVFTSISYILFSLPFIISNPSMLYRCINLPILIGFVLCFISSFS